MTKLFGLEPLKQTEHQKAVKELAALCFNNQRGFEYPVWRAGNRGRIAAAANCLALMPGLRAS